MLQFGERDSSWDYAHATYVLALKRAVRNKDWSIVKALAQVLTSSLPDSPKNVRMKEHSKLVAQNPNYYLNHCHWKKGRDYT